MMNIENADIPKESSQNVTDMKYGIYTLIDLNWYAKRNYIIESEISVAHNALTKYQCVLTQKKYEKK